VHISGIRISNYKSFYSPTTIRFAPGINLVVGVNNAGKTALLEALTLAVHNVPHLRQGINPRETSEVCVEFFISPAELDGMVSEHEVLYLPLAVTTGGAPHFLTSALRAGITLTGQKQSGRWIEFEYSVEGNELEVDHSKLIALRDYRNGVLNWKQQPRTDDQDSPIQLDRVCEEFAKNIFFFKSERVGLFGCNRENTYTLRNDAANLPAVLEKLKRENTGLFLRYLETVRRVLPTIGDVSILDHKDNNISISIWTRDSSSELESLAYPLKDCGTGIGQVLAILYVIIRNPPSAIIIDEPTSFLHPAATRELIRIFKENTQHQYFISTHSHEVFAEVEPEFYTKLSYSDFQTQVERVSVEQLGETYRELGISPFYEFTLWVEGDTELEVFPKLIKNKDVRICKLYSASDVTRKQTEIGRLCTMYAELTRQSGFNPCPRIKILVDREHLNSSENRKNRTNSVLHFLPRKMYENYLLDPDAVAAVINSYLSPDSFISSLAVESIFKQNRLEYPSEKDWLVQTDGVKLLKKVFNELTDSRVQFNKIGKNAPHATQLTDWLLANRESGLQELQEFITNLLELE
jgi:AAA15 family ATPase/GTPase